MAKRKKIRIRIKKKNFTIFLIFMGVLIYSFYLLIHTTIKLIETSIPKKEEKEIKEEKKEKKKEEKNISPTEEKLKELDNINEQINYFNNDNIDRYINYKKLHPDFDIIKVIKYVNMNLDYNYYEKKEKALNPNTNIILVNKYYYMEENEVPNNLETINNNYALDNAKLVREAKNAFEEMAKNAASENLSIIAMSAYRNYTYQVSLYNRYVRSDGKENADTYSGRPGHSEHQTGLAVDVYNGKVDYTKFETTNEFTWMMNHAHEYGFILRFPKGKEFETGYIYESWHYRYVGKEIAKEIKERNICLEEYIATQAVSN